MIKSYTCGCTLCLNSSGQVKFKINACEPSSKCKAKSVNKEDSKKLIVVKKTK